MLTLGIPAFRLEKDVVQAEIEIIKAMGVTFKTGIEVGKDITLAQLRQEGYHAFYLAIGAQGGKLLGIPGEAAKGVYTGIDVLKGINAGNDFSLPGKTIVIGGGNVAIDVARAAVRSDSTQVQLFCLESRETMPASEDEILEAEEEKIILNNAYGPSRILEENGKVKAVEFVQCLSVFDEEGRFAPQFDQNKTITVEADNVILTVGQQILWGELLSGTQLELNPNFTAKADPFTYQTT
ncbi:MAG: FAD-dependent oxidoreductase, partial [Anaerovoracaceae bacterium]